MSEHRINVVQKQSDGLLGPVYYVLQDSQTGVNYLFVLNGYGGGLTVMVDAEGKPLVTPVQPD